MEQAWLIESKPHYLSKQMLPKCGVHLLLILLFVWQHCWELYKCCGCGCHGNKTSRSLQRGRRNNVPVVVRMDTRYVYFSFLFTGIPLSFKKTRASSWIWLLTNMFCFANRFSLSVVATYFFFKDDNSKDNKEETHYYSASWLLYFWGTLLTSLLLLRNRKDLENVFEMIEEITKTQSRRDFEVLLSKTVVVLLTVAKVALNAFDITSYFIHTTHADMNKTESTVLTLLSYPVHSFTWVVFYSIAVIWVDNRASTLQNYQTTFLFGKIC